MAKEIGTTIQVEISELAGYEFFIDGEKVSWEDMTRKQQIKVLNSFSSGLELFSKFLKE